MNQNTHINLSARAAVEHEGGSNGEERVTSC